MISSDAIIDITVDSRLAKENNTFGRLYQRVWNNNILKKDPKIRVYKAAVLTTPLDGAESWSPAVATCASFWLVNLRPNEV